MLLTLFSFFFICASISASDEQPNILYIFTDDQSVRSVSAYKKAHTWVSTPHIDRLAKSGLRFHPVLHWYLVPTFPCFRPYRLAAT
jgi:hypothetical protein